jgi:hypothetical protein
VLSKAPRVPRRFFTVPPNRSSHIPRDSSCPSHFALTYHTLGSSVPVFSVTPTRAAHRDALRRIFLSSRPERAGFFLRPVYERRPAQWRDCGKALDTFRSTGPTTRQKPAHVAAAGRGGPLSPMRIRSGSLSSHVRRKQKRGLKAPKPQCSDSPTIRDSWHRSSGIRSEESTTV